MSLWGLHVHARELGFIAMFVYVNSSVIFSFQVYYKVNIDTIYPLELMFTKVG